MERAKESQLIVRSRSGDSTAFGQLIDRHKRHVLRVCVRLLGNLEDAKDVAQETFLQAFLGLERFREESRFSTWLYRIAVNLCQNVLRRQSPSVEPLAASFRDPGLTPEASLLRRERGWRLDQALQRLSPELRVAVVLRDVLGFSYAEIAESLGIPLGTVKSRISAARWALRRDLEESDEL
jgi:RNA polymerase sigma-70 factor (ECF subfamily)